MLPRIRAVVQSRIPDRSPREGGHIHDLPTQGSTMWCGSVSSRHPHFRIDDGPASNI